jgi:hypothetical protein
METKYIAYIVVLLLVVGMLPDRFIHKSIDTIVLVIVTLLLVWYLGDELIEASMIIYGLGAVYFISQGKRNGEDFRRETSSDPFDPHERMIKSEKKLFRYKVVHWITLVSVVIICFAFSYVNANDTTKDILFFALYVTCSIYFYVGAFRDGWTSEGERLKHLKTS